MKVVCDSCQAKYQVPDERVAGKKLKIRCKKCAGTIIVRGDQLSAPAAQPAAQPEQGWQDEATVAVSRNEPSVEWFASVDGGEHGPMDEETLVSWLIEQPGAWDTYVWREGFGDWVLARYVDSLTEAAEARGAVVDEEQGSSEAEGDEEAVPTQMRPNALLEAQQAEAQSMRAPASAPRYESFSVEPVAVASVSVADSAPSFAASSGYGSSPNVAPSASYDSNPGAAPSASYGSSPAVSQGYSQNYGQAARATAAAPRVSAAAAMTGSRNEESVLFDASALQRVASPSRANTSPTFSSPRDGYATGDGSGLIDIRALAAMSAASVAKKEADAEAAQRPEPLLPQTSELPTLDTLAPVAMPQQAPKRSSNAMPIALFGAAVVLAAAIVTVAVVLDTKEPSLESPAAASAPIEPEPTTPTLAAAEAEAPAEEEAQATTEPEEGSDEESASADEEPAADDSAEAEAPEEEVTAAKPAAGPSAKARAAARRRRLAATRKARAEKAEVATAEPKEEEPLFKDEPKAEEEKPAAAPEPKEESPSIDDLIAGTSSKPSAPAKSRSIDDLLDNAVDESAPAAKKAAPAPASNLPAQPSRDDVLSAMRSVTPAVQRCGSQNGQTGVAKVKITVAGSGKVSDTSASGVTGPAVGCIEQAVKKAKFPAFSKPSFTVNFPFRL